MKYAILTVFTAGFMVACGATEPVATAAKNDYAQLPLTANVLTRPQWQALERFPARYPKKEVMAANTGCATVEYVIKPDNTVTSIRVAESSSRYFAKEAEQVVAKWKWSALPAGILDKPVKTQTRFEFCLEDGSGQCRLEKLASKTECSGSDIIASVGVRVSRG
ncbi:MAG: energy transducer TonB [Pseudomonadota bacterium]|nr:energy transducer TonB [Pseudomonadota bacterium]